MATRIAVSGSPPNGRLSLFRISAVDADHTVLDGAVIVLIEPHSEQPSKQPHVCGRWLPELAPSTGLRKEYTEGTVDWHELVRRYSLELRERPNPCQQLRSLASERGIALRSNASDPRYSIESALAEHIIQLECEDRWNRGLMIGGFVFPVRDEVAKAGGLYFARHKAWMMPDREAWQYIQSLLPGDF